MQAKLAKSFDPDHARVLVVGPMSSGKTTLVRSLCHGGTGGTAAAGARSKAPPTIGCNVDVKLLARGYADRSIEFWDVGGNPDAALARGMFFEDSEAAGVLLVYDVSNPRSLRELRGWTDELASAGVRILGSGGNMGARSCGAGTPGASEGGTALRHQDREDGLESLTDLEGGSGGIGGAAGAVPFLMVGTKEEMGEGVRRSGARLAAELGMGHVAVCARRLDNDEHFDRFFSEVFRHHTGRHMPGDDWGALEQEGQGTYFPPTTPEEAFNIDRTGARRSQTPAGWGSDSTSNAARQKQDCGSLKRTGYFSKRTDDSFERGASEKVGVAAVASNGAGLVWPIHRGGASACAAGGQQSRKKQS